MFKALMGDGSGSDVRSNSSSGSKSSKHKSHRSTSSRKSSRGDDRERGLGDLSAYPSSSRSRKYRLTEEPEELRDSDRVIIERAPGGKSVYENNDNDNDRDSKSSRRREKKGKSRSSRDSYPSMSGAGGQFAADISAPGFSQFPMQYDTMIPGGPPGSAPPPPTTSAAYDPHVHQQFPGQFPMSVAEPYRPPHPAGEAAEYYGDQGQSVAEQPGVRPDQPAVIPNSHTHLIAASSTANPPPEPSSVGQVGAAASYYSGNIVEEPSQISSTQGKPSSGHSKPPKPSKPDSNYAGSSSYSSPHLNNMGAALGTAAAGAAASYYAGNAFDEHSQVSSSQGKPPSGYSKPPEPSHPGSNYAGSSSNDRPDSHSMGAALGTAAAGAAASYYAGNTFDEHSQVSSPQGKPPTGYSKPPKPSQSGSAYPATGESSSHKPPNSHHMGAAIGTAAAGAAAGYMMGHHHHSSSPEHDSQYTMQNIEPSSIGGTPLAAGAAGAAAYGMHYHGSHGPPPPYQSGGLAYQQRRRGPLGRFVDFWRDPEGVGMFEEYTETIGVCRYCFEPGTSPRDAPRKHHYHRRRRSWDRYSSSSRVDKLGRYSSSDGEGRRRRKSKKTSWIPGLLGGYAAKSIFTNKDFDDTYSVKSGRVMSDGESVSRLDRKSQTSCGVYKHSHRSRSADRKDRYDDRRVRSRSRSTSASRHSALRDAALGAAVGGAAYAATKSHHRSRSPKKGRRRRSSSSGSSSAGSSGPSRKSVAGGLTSFFTASSANRKKRQGRKSKGIFSFNNSSSSSLDADLAFGSGRSRKPGKSKGKHKSDHDIDATLLGLGATATALAASSHSHGSRTGEIFADKDPRLHSSAAGHDEGWEDVESGSQSANSDLAFGGSSADSSDGSHGSASGKDGWGWGWGGGKKKKKPRSSDSHLPSGAASAAGTFGGAALASAYYKHSKHSSQDDVSRTGSLQHVVPVPTSDPSNFDAVRDSPASHPPLVRPGSIPLQQPQPVTPVSQAVYTTSGEPAYYTGPIGPSGVEGVLAGFAEKYQESGRSEISSAIKRHHRRSDSSPILPSESMQDVPTPGIKRRSTTKDSPSVQFDLTEEQAQKERRASRRERKRESRSDGPQLIDREWELESQDRRKERCRRSGEYDEEDDSHWVGAAAAGTIGAAAAAAALSSRSSKDDSSETSQRRHSERREQRRTERRRGEGQSDIFSLPEGSEYMPGTRSAWDQGGKNTTRRSPHGSPVHDDYAQFFAPEELQHSSDSNKRGGDDGTPRIVEIEPASVRFSREMSRMPEGSQVKDGSTSWSIPMLNLIEPTPPQSLSGSVRDPASPTHESAQRTYGNDESRRAGSRVSWSDQETRQYDTPSKSTDQESHEREVQEEGRDPSPPEESVRQRGTGSGKPSGAYGEDLEFAATVAAATAAAGFDSSVVTDDPTYHTRTSPPGSDAEPHGFVEGEVGSDDEAAEGHGSRDNEDARDTEWEPKQFSESEPAGFADDNDFSMPGGFETERAAEKSRRQRKSSKLRSTDALSEPAQFEDRGSSREHGSRSRDDASIDEYKSHRQQREEKRRHRYEEFTGSEERSTEYGKV